MEVDEVFRNLISFDQQCFPFIDRFSRFGVVFQNEAGLGPSTLYPRSVVGTYRLADPLLGLKLLEEGFSLPLRAESSDYFPWKTVQKTNFNGVEFRSVSLFVDEDTLIVKYVLTNYGSETQCLDLEWNGNFCGELNRYFTNYYPGSDKRPRKPFLSVDSRSIIGGFDYSYSKQDTPIAQFKITPLFEDGRLKKDDKSYWIDIDPFELEVNCSREFEFLIQYKASSKGIPVSFSTYVPIDDFAKLECRNRDQFLKAINWADFFGRKLGILDLYKIRARYALLRNGLKGNSNFKNEIACLCTPDGSDFSCVFFWDTLFSSTSISDFNRDYSKSAIKTAFFDMDSRDGSTSERKFDHSPSVRMSQQSPQSPIASWAVWSYLKKHQDLGFLKEMLPILESNNAFWRIYSDLDRDGLAEFRWSGQIGDNLPLWDDYGDYSGVGNCSWVPPIASVALNSFLYLDCSIISELHQKLGNSKESKVWETYRDELWKNIFEICYCKSDDAFWDYNHHTRRFHKNKTFYMFWPLFAGMPVSENTARNLIENYLLNESMFFGPVPFPSVAYNEPEYDAWGYWRGKNWPHISYWLLETLVNWGYEKEADLAATRLLYHYGKSNGFLENYPTVREFYNPNNVDPRRFRVEGFSDYNWGAASFYLIANRQYRNPIYIPSGIKCKN